MHQLNLAACDESILQVLLVRDCGVNELKRLLKRNVRTVSNHLKIMEAEGFVAYEKIGKKKLYRLTEKGRDACALLRIKREVGFIGLEWAEAKIQQGFKVRFLSDLTGLPNHKRWLFAWHPQSGECDLAAIFGVRSVKSKPGEGPRYMAQLVDRSKSPDKPLKSCELFEYLRDRVKDWNNEREIEKALKAFWNLDNFNAYVCAFAPEEISFGFPSEIGHFSSLMFVGFGYQKEFPFIPNMTLLDGGFNLSKNLKVLIEYQVNVTMLLVYSWLVAKKTIDPDSVSDEILSRALTSMFNLSTIVACKNAQNGKCKKMDVRCIAQTEKGLDFSRCPILLEEVRQVKINYNKVQEAS